MAQLFTLFRYSKRDIKKKRVRKYAEEIKSTAEFIAWVKNTVIL